eukprot:TRINITY_DN13642_c0_g1_i1.p1 TRINITY_DN13642_c0_g1~~TRINITY_DN13642_c0_g1_i1.p1  ORF type:complete len:405 (+),score=61.85 TRINITY_DN13642_c0_g1_i1:78-1217(+)
MSAAAIAQLVAVAMAGTYNRNGVLNITNALVVHVPSMNETICVVGSGSGWVHVVEGQGWGNPSITQSVQVQGGGDVTAVTSDTEGEFYYITSRAVDGSNSYLTILDGSSYSIISEIELQGGANDVALDTATSTAYVSTISKMIHSVNITDKASPYVISTASACGEKISLSGDYMYTACGSDSMVYVFAMPGAEVGAEMYNYTLPLPPVDVMFYNNQLFVLTRNTLFAYKVVPPTWEPSSTWTKIYNVTYGGLARSNPVAYNSIGDVFVATTNEVRVVSANDLSISPYYVGIDAVSSVSVYQQSRLFATTPTELQVFSLSKPRSFSPLSVLAIVVGSIAVVFIAGAVFYHQRIHNGPRYGRDDERYSFRGDATQDRGAYS